MSCFDNFVKSITGILDYKFDWAPLTNEAEGGVSDWLQTGECIASFTIDGDGLTVASSSLTDSDTSVTVWLSGGEDGKYYRPQCHIVTDSIPPREDDRSMTIKGDIR